MVSAQPYNSCLLTAFSRGKDYYNCPLNNNTGDLVDCNKTEMIPLPQGIAQDFNYWTEAFEWGRWGDFFWDHLNKSSLGVSEVLKAQRPLVLENQTNAHLQLIASHMGVGRTPQCRAGIIEALKSADDYDSAGWQAATTLMTLIPALLTIGNLFVPRSSEVFATSFPVGFMSAVFSLGLPVRSISGIGSKQHIRFALFTGKARRQISQLGKKMFSKQDSPIDENPRIARHKVHLEDLQLWSSPPPNNPMATFGDEAEATEAAFSTIKRKCQKWRRRAHRWQLAAFTIASVQFLIVYVLAVLLFYVSH
jgi:hypothetical protein